MFQRDRYHERGNARRVDVSAADQKKYRMIGHFNLFLEVILLRSRILNLANLLECHFNDNECNFYDNDMVIIYWIIMVPVGCL
jgi:hypothetical protein